MELGLQMMTEDDNKSTKVFIETVVIRYCKRVIQLISFLFCSTTQNTLGILAEGGQTIL